VRRISVVAEHVEVIGVDAPDHLAPWLTGGRHHPVAVPGGQDVGPPLLENREKETRDLGSALLGELAEELVEQLVEHRGFRADDLVASPLHRVCELEQQRDRCPVAAQRHDGGERQHPEHPLARQGGEELCAGRAVMWGRNAHDRADPHRHRRALVDAR
jgi:hypothetical protein